MNYAKLFGSILDSSLWMESSDVRIVWVTMLAMADRDGEVLASVPGLAKRASVSREACEAALAAFLAPDPDSRTKDYEGRRIEEIDGGWRLLNHDKYRDMMGTDDRRERDAERAKRYRDRKSSRDASRSVTASRDASRPVTPNHARHDIRSDQIRSDQTHTENARARVEPMVGEDRPTSAALIRAAYDARLLEATAAPASWGATNAKHVEALADWLDRLAPEDPRATVAQLMDAYFREPWARQKAFPLGPLAQNPSRYLNAAEGRLEALKRKADEIKAQRGICDEWRVAMDEWIAARKRLARDTEVSNGSN